MERGVQHHDHEFAFRISMTMVNAGPFPRNALSCASQSWDPLGVVQIPTELLPMRQEFRVPRIYAPKRLKKIPHNELCNFEMEKSRGSERGRRGAMDRRKPRETLLPTPMKLPWLLIVRGASNETRLLVLKWVTGGETGKRCGIAPPLGLERIKNDSEKVWASAGI
jgi:hypothetical protein